MKAILISTDGFSIETEEFSSAEEAKEEMDRQYDSYSVLPEYEEFSYCGDSDACLYNETGVLVWRVVEV